MASFDSLDALTPDPKNANLGTGRGRALLKESVGDCGLGRSILVDKHGVVIAGNKTLEVAKAAGADLEVVETTGDELVVVQRTDLNLLEDEKARRLAYYDNRVQEVDLAWSSPQLHEDLLAGVELNQVFFPEEIDRLALPEVGDDGLTDTGDPLAKPAKPGAAAKPIPVTLVFNTVEQQLRWRAFMRRLREVYPHLTTPGARLSAHLKAQGIT